MRNAKTKGLHGDGGGLFLQVGIHGGKSWIFRWKQASKMRLMGLGPVLCADERVRKVSFTGSHDVGRRIAAVAGVKRLSLELGANCPVIVLPDADLEQVSAAPLQ